MAVRDSCVRVYSKYKLQFYRLYVLSHIRPIENWYISNPLKLRGPQKEFPRLKAPEREFDLIWSKSRIRSKSSPSWHTVYNADSALCTVFQPFYCLTNVTHESIFIGFNMQHPEEVRYNCFNFVHLALKLWLHYLVKFAGLTPAMYNMPVLPDVHILNFWIAKTFSGSVYIYICMKSYNKFT